ncbi:hypothetical protein DSO57_1017531 [Entomophthora muscae]|uniref:Uncharacterized protein n=1 Tax=Entomophthora muscae TaxID=34485 RepID=A0ACC2U2V0_9FUNG|nr:hypothetical protein DSO57_1017531 [Entomophthora muscae]
MLYPTLPTPRKLHEMDRVHVDIAIEASQKRTRTMMAKAAELAIVALDLEKELRWSEALTAYIEVCSYFKRILEVAESKDISDILFVYHKYSKRMAYIRSKTKQQLPKDLSTSRYPKLDAAGTNSESALSQQPQEETSILNAKGPSPKYGRFRSDSYTNPPTSSPLVSPRRPSLASPSSSLAQAARSPNSRNLPAGRLSRYDLKPDTLDTSELSRFSRRIASSPNERVIASAVGRKEANSLQTNIPTSKYKETPPPSLKEKQELGRLLDLKSIPETEEKSSIRFSGEIKA